LRHAFAQSIVYALHKIDNDSTSSSSQMHITIIW
jgi:hypothetical protein